MLKKLAKTCVLFLIEHFLLEKRWIVFTRRNKKGKLGIVADPAKIDVVCLGGDPIGFAKKVTNPDEGYTEIKAQCIPFRDSETLFITYAEAYNYYQAMKKLERKAKPAKVVKNIKGNNTISAINPKKGKRKVA